MKQQTGRGTRVGVLSQGFAPIRSRAKGSLRSTPACLCRRCIKSVEHWIHPTVGGRMICPEGNIWITPVHRCPVFRGNAINRRKRLCKRLLWLQPLPLVWPPPEALRLLSPTPGPPLRGDLGHSMFLCKFFRKKVLEVWNNSRFFGNFAFPQVLTATIVLSCRQKE